MLVDVDVSLSDIRAAHERLQGVVHQTPVMTSRTLNEIVGCDASLYCHLCCDLCHSFFHQNILDLYI